MGLWRMSWNPGFDFLSLELFNWYWRFVGVADTTFFFLYICTTEFLLNFSLSFLSVALMFSWQLLYNNHNHQIGLAGSPNLFQCRTLEFPE